MTNIDKVSLAISEWGFNVVKNILPHMQIPPNSQLGHIMGMLGTDPSKYNIWNELGFLAEPMIQTMVAPSVNKFLAGMPDEQIPDVVMKFVDSFIGRAQEKGSVNLLGLELGQGSFERLKEILQSKFNG